MHVKPCNSSKQRDCSVLFISFLYNPEKSFSAREYFRIAIRWLQGAHTPCAAGLYTPAAARFTLKKRHWPMVPSVVKNGLGHPSTKKSMVPLGLSDGPNTHPNINTNPRIYRPVDWSRSISTVDRITLTEEYGRYWRSIGLHSIRIAVDRGSRIKYRNNLWSILSTTPVKISACWLLHRLIKFNKICWEKRPAKPRPNLPTSFCRHDLKNTQPHLNKCTAQECSNHTVAEHACRKMYILWFTKTKWVQ